MIAAGNVQEEKELNQICTMALSNLENYIDKIRNHEGEAEMADVIKAHNYYCLLYTSPSPRDCKTSRMPSSA